MQGPVLITGTSSGIGLETAVYLARRGLRVMATMRDVNRRGELDAAAARQGVSVDVLPLDVTDAAGIRAAVETVVGRCGSIAALVNNAGIQVRGYFEDVPEPEFRRVFETNVFGAMALTRAVLPYMRRAGRGRIVLVGSVGGRFGWVGLSAYCASKFALEGFGETLAMEVAPLGIQVSLVEPGIIDTAIWGKNRGVTAAALDPAGPYYAWFQEAERMSDWAVRSSSTMPLHVAEAVYRALTARRPRLRYLVGRRAGQLLALRRLLPADLFERMCVGLLVNRATRARDPKGQVDG